MINVLPQPLQWKIHEICLLFSNDFWFRGWLFNEDPNQFPYPYNVLYDDEWGYSD